MEALSEGLVSRFSVYSRLRKVRHHCFCCVILRVFFLPCLHQWKVNLVFNTPPEPSRIAPVLIYTPLAARDVSGKVSSPKRQLLGVTRDKTNQKYH